MPKKYVPLLPAAGSRTSSDTATSPSIPETSLKRKRIGTQVACNACRQKKTRCDGQRPMCAPCVKRTTECVYNDKREVVDESIEVLNILKATPESTALDILRLLRSSKDLTTVLSIVRGGMDGKQRLSVYEAARGTAMPTASPLEFELMIKNPSTYPVLQAVDVPALEASNLLRSVNVGRARSSQSEQSPIPLETQILRPYLDADANSDLQAGSANVDHDSAIKPYRKQAALDNLRKPEAKLCDERLRLLDITFWINVPIPSELAARVISLYLETDHPLLGTFDPDQFVFDLVNYRQLSCSPLLVSTLLFWGCQMYSAIEKDAQKYARQLCLEAERLWDTEKEHDTTINMAAAQLLSLASMGNGRDHVVVQLQAEASEMGTRLCLFGVDEATALRAFQQTSRELQNATCFAAWGVFNWIVLCSFFYQQPNLAYPKFPPWLPIPGDTGQEALHDPNASKTFASVLLSIPLPRYMGTTFPALCSFWRIMHGVSVKYFSTQFLREHRDVEFAEFKYRELIAWAENLPPPLLRADDSPHHVVIFHMWLHAAILDIFRPFVQSPEKYRLRTFSASGTPEAVYKASVNQLKQLIIWYRSSYESSTYTILWHTALTYVANAAMRDADEDPQWRMYFLLCIYGYETLRRPFRISEAIGRGLLTMLLRDRHITSDDAREILRQLEERGVNNRSENIRATFMGDLMLALKHPEMATVEHLAGDFDDMALINEFTVDEPMVTNGPV